MELVIGWALVLIWSVAAIGLMITMGVFSSRPLHHAPRRLSRLSLPMLFGVTLLYLMTAILAHAAVYGVAPPPAAATGSAPATASAPATTTTQPAESASELEKYVFDSATKVLPTIAILVLAYFFVVGRLPGWGLAIRGIPRGFIAGFLGFLVIIPLIWVWNAVVVEIYHSFQHEIVVHETLQQLARPVPLFEKAGYILFAVVAAPIFEELYFRGLVQTILIQPGQTIFASVAPAPNYQPGAAKRWTAILLASAYFSMVHTMDHWPILMLLAVAIGYVYERTGTLWAPITLHASFNATSIYFNMTGKG